MMRLRSLGKYLAPAALVVLSAASSGCIKRILVDGQVSLFLYGRPTFDALGDYEQGNVAEQASLAMYEGFHRLSPGNEDALLLLVKNWTFYGYAFVEDAMETAEDAGNAPLAAYHRRRAVMAYERAVFYGTELLGHEDDGFEKAKGSEGALATWLERNFDDAEQADSLFWLGYAWLARIEVSKGDALGAKKAGERFVGKALIERAVKLDRQVGEGKGLMALAAYRAHEKPVDGNAVKKMFDDARAATLPKGSAMLVAFTEASTYACTAGDSALYTQLLKQVITTEEPDFAHQLENEVARHRARRWISPVRAKAHCGF